MAIKKELNIKGTRISGRIWKKPAKPIRSIIAQNAGKISQEKIKTKWLKAKREKQALKEIGKESKQLIEKRKQERKIRGKQIKIKRQKKIENEIKSAGNNLIIIGTKKYSKLPKKAKKGLTKLTPEMIGIIRSRKR